MESTCSSLLDASEVITEGAALLDRFIEETGLSCAAVAAAIGVSRVAVWKWRTGVFVPAVEHRAALERWTASVRPGAGVSSAAWDRAVDQ